MKEVHFVMPLKFLFSYYHPQVSFLLPNQRLNLIHWKFFHLEHGTQRDWSSKYFSVSGSSLISIVLFVEETPNSLYSPCYTTITMLQIPIFFFTAKPSYQDFNSLHLVQCGHKNLQIFFLMT